MKPLDMDAVRRALPGRRIDWYAVVDSTMSAAALLPPGSAVVAEEQTAGQGRHGHRWHSEPGTGLYCSIVLPPMDTAPVITLALGLAAAEAIAEATGLRPDLRWPNDLMARERKLAGILVQAAGTALVAGIGVNVGHRVFPPELAGEATSLRLELGREVPREDLLAALLPAVDSYCKMLKEGGRDAILKRFTYGSSYASGKRVVVEQAGGAVRGTTAGLDPAGFLRVRRDDGTETLILAGGVRAAGT